MRGYVMNNQFRAHEDQRAIWDEQIRVAVWRIELAKLAIVNAAKNHRLPWVDQQFLQFGKAVRVSCSGWKRLIMSEPPNSTKGVCVLIAEVIALGQIIEVRHGSFFKG